MKNAFLKNYGATLLLLLGLVVGGVLGAVLGEDARALRVPGTLFLNLVFMLVVPLVFFSVAHSISVMQRNGVIGRVLVTSLGVFLAMSLIAGIFGYAFMSVWNPFARVLGEGGTAAGGAMGAEGCVYFAACGDDDAVIRTKELVRSLHAEPPTAL